MKLKLRKIGTSYGVIIPRKLITDEDFNAEEIDIEIRGAEFIEKVVADTRKTATEAVMDDRTSNFPPPEKIIFNPAEIKSAKTLIPGDEVPLEGELT
jgi:antitoxin component of MazEF toxin-antitoxin module